MSSASSPTKSPSPAPRSTTRVGSKRRWPSSPPAGSRSTCSPSRPTSRWKKSGRPAPSWLPDNWPARSWWSPAESWATASMPVLPRLRFAESVEIGGVQTEYSPLDLGFQVLDRLEKLLGGAGECGVGVGVVGTPDDPRRADKWSQGRQCGLVYLETHPALASEVLAGQE